MSPEPRYQRRKEDRPQEIAEAAFDVFAEKGFAAARVDDVAKRAGVSKGLTYLYYKTKADLFKAVIKNVVVRRLDGLIDSLDSSEQSPEEFIRGPLLTFMKAIPGSPVAVVIRLLLTEGRRHPDLVDYYYENVISKGLAAIQRFIEEGVRRKEFKESALQVQPHLVLAPVIMATIWRMLLGERTLDTDKLIETHIDMLLTQLKEPQKK